MNIPPDMSEFREDVDTALEVWTRVLVGHLGDRLDYAYAKGSAVKEWSSFIDYVPLISDLDIHVRVKAGASFFIDPSTSFDDALSMSTEYENLFSRARPAAYHTPRTQLMVLNEWEEEPNFVPPRIGDVHVLTGKPKQEMLPSPEEVRRIDREGLLGMTEFLDSLPSKMYDRTGLDIWTLVRQMTWRVSPSPVRVLAQLYDDPYECWAWNRSRICAELDSRGLTAISSAYRDYYESSWQAYLSDFRNWNSLRAMVKQGRLVMMLCRDFVSRK